MINIINNQKNENQDHTELSSHTRMTGSTKVILFKREIISNDLVVDQECLLYQKAELPKRN